MKSGRFLIFIILLSILSSLANSQEIPFPVRNTGIYDFLDELANAQVISINSAVKPYSRLFIANKLMEADGKRESLPARQLKELDFYLLDFRKELKASGIRHQASGEGKQGEGGVWLNIRRGSPDSYREGEGERGRRIDLFFYSDSMFQLTVNPILGGEIFNNSSGRATYVRNGVEARAYVNHWGFYASLRDNHEKPLLGKPAYLTRRTDGPMKNETDWSDMQGGITYSWRWGSAGLVKDDISWGTNYNGANIFGGNNPSYIQLRLHINPVKWFDFNYFHGWLNSMVVDSAKSFWVTNSYGTDYREVYRRKYIAANMFTFTPFKYLNLSAGNSVIYDNATLNPAFLVPLFFYKSVDHSVSSGIDNMNSQMFFDISSRQIRYLHLYGTLFVDELSVSRFFKKDEWNFFSWKAGLRLDNYPFHDLSFTTEFTYSYPLAFQHYVPTLTFESNNFNLGHYLRDNSREWYLALDYRPLRAMDIRLSFTDAIRGPDYTELGTNRLGNPPLATVNWHNTSFGINASFQLINDLYIWLSAYNSNIRGDMRWSPEYFYGRKTTVNAGVTVGF